MRGQVEGSWRVGSRRGGTGAGWDGKKQEEKRRRA